MCAYKSGQNRLTRRRPVQQQQQRIGGNRENRQEQRHGHDGGDVAQPHGAGDHEAEPALRGEHFADQDAEQGQREAKPRAGEHFGEHRGQGDMPRHLAGGQPHGLGGTPVHRLDLQDRLHGEDRHRNQAVHGPERDLGGDAEAEAQQHQRIERHLRERIERDQNRLGDDCRGAAQAERDAERDAADQRDQRGGDERAGGFRDIEPEPFGAEQFSEMLDGVERGGQRDVAGDPVQDLPGGKDADEKQDEIDKTFHRRLTVAAGFAADDRWCRAPHWRRSRQ